MNTVASALGVPPEAAPVVYACTAVVVMMVTWALSPPKVPPESKPYGVLDSKNVLWRATSVGKFVSVPGEGLAHVWAVVERTAKRYPSKLAVGARPLLKREFEPDPDNPKRSFEKLSFGEYEWLTYAQYHARACELAAGLVSFAKLKPKDRLVIYAETQRDWMVAALAAFRQDVTVVTIYATLGEEGVVHGINQTKATAVVADAKLLPVLAAAASQCPQLKYVVTISSDMQPSDLEKLSKCGVSVKPLDECLLDGAAAPVEPAQVTAEDIAVIMYTSGTTGLPKGVLISHGNFMAAVAGMKHALGGYVRPEDVYLAYLPLAHIMEMAAEVCQMFFGIAIGYGSPHTLTSTGVKLAKGQVGDAPMLHPTIMVFAPAVLDKVYSAITAKVSKGSPLVKALFNAAMRAGVANYERGGIGAGFLYNALVFKKIQALLGGKVRVMLTGSAPLSPDVQKFVQTVFDAPVRQGYGLTETCAGTVIANLADNTTSCVGPPTAAACIRLRDYTEGGYLFADKEKPGVMMPRGEILIGGPMVTQGYLVDAEKPDPEVAKKNETEYTTIDGVRYFCSGDIGQILPDGQLMIIDRKKDLVKLQQGEYVALSKVENALKNSPYIDLPMCYAKSTHSYCIALACPNEPAVSAYAQSKGISGSFDELCAHADVVKEVSKSALEACKAAKLVGFEIPKKLGLVADPWTPENDMLTAAMKLKRNQIVARHKEELDKLYA